MSAQSDYKQAVADLETFCADETNFDVEILTETYPMSVKFTPKAQMSLFDEQENYRVDENGEIRNITISLGQTTRVLSTLRFKMDAKLLKKMMKLSEKVGHAYLHAFREASQLAPGILKKAVDKFIDEMWTTSIPDASVALFNRAKFDEIVDKVLLGVVNGEAEPLPEEDPDEEHPTYTAAIELEPRFDIPEEIQKLGIIECEISGDDLEEARADAIASLEKMLAAIKYPVSRVRYLLRTSRNDEYVDTEEISADWDGESLKEGKA